MSLSSFRLPQVRCYNDKFDISDIQANHAVKLLEFFKDLRELEGTPGKAVKMIDPVNEDIAAMELVVKE